MKKYNANVTYEFDAEDSRTAKNLVHDSITVHGNGRIVRLDFYETINQPFSAITVTRADVWNAVNCTEADVMTITDDEMRAIARLVNEYTQNGYDFDGDVCQATNIVRPDIKEVQS